MTLALQSYGLEPVSLTLTLSRDLAGSLTANAAATRLTTTRPGQNAVYGFAGTAGKRMALAVPAMDIPGYAQQMHVHRPDGSYLNGSMLYSGQPNQLVLEPLPISGNYTVRLDLGESPGTLDLQLVEARTGTLAVDAAPIPMTLLPGQALDYGVEGTAGQTLGVVLSDFATTPGPVYWMLEFVNPWGTVVHTCTVGGAASSSCRFPTLGATGSYRIRMQPGPQGSSFKLQMRSTI